MRSRTCLQSRKSEPFPKGVRAIPIPGVHKDKRDANANIEPINARLVAKGFRQKERVDLEEVFVPLSKCSFGTLLRSTERDPYV